MIDIFWIKLSTNIFSNRKILILLKEKDGDLYFRVWIQLLTIAGQCNYKGKLVIGDNIPITISELARIIGKSDRKVEKILERLIQLEMITCIDNVYAIKNWDKYQSADKLEQIREQNRVRQSKFREKKKVESNVNVTLGNA
ncbi:MAG: phage replisome organizer N-terminal domain-containing protein [Oscillospiraceae bacterium]|nr:phage replisome organizer N-terminal domain-containing protein [Oscillospiraceae bacterium]